MTSGKTIGASLLLSWLALATMPLSHASNVDELKRLQKCYAIFVKQRIQTSDPLWVKVNTGAMSGTDACMNVLDQAQIGSNGKISQYSGDPDHDVGARVLSSFLEFNRSQFTVPDYLTTVQGSSAITADLIDSNDPAYHLLYSLFRPGERFSNVVTRDSNLVAVRYSASASSHSRKVTDINSTLAFTVGHTVVDTAMGMNLAVKTADPWNVTPAATGELIGLTEDTRNNVMPVVNDPVLQAPAAAVLVNHTIQFAVKASTGIAPFSYEILFQPTGGTSSINSSTGLFSAGTQIGAFGVKVTDSKGSVGILNLTISPLTTTDANGNTVTTVIKAGTQSSGTYAFAFMAGQNVTEHFGAGIIGTQAYLLGNNDKVGPVTGGTNAYRVWSKNVMSDLLCRTVPALRSSDVLSMGFVNTASTLPFRQGISCMQCHATMDPMAAAIRKIRVGYSESKDGTGSTGVKFFANSQGIDTQSSSAYPELGEDANFYKRPADASLLFRSYDGSLVNKSVTGLPALGQAIAQTDDLYACAAKRYYKFLTGIDVDLSDLEDPINAPNLSQAQLNFRKKVISLGQQLKQDQSLRSMIKTIVSSDTFINPDYGK